MSLRTWKSHFHFNRSEQSGIVLLLSILIGMTFLNYFFPFSKEPLVDTHSATVLALQKQMDSLRKVEIGDRKPKLFPFNPNYITDFKAYTLGLSPEAFDRLKAYRENGKWINTVSDFERVTGVDKKWLDSIGPYFKFPEWVARTATKPKKYFNRKKSFSEKIDLNLATQEQLEQIYGIGPTFGKRIIDFRQKLGGFTEDVQLYFVYGLKPETVEKVLQNFTVKTPKEIEKMDINTVSASDIATLPGISFALAKDIWEFVQLREGIHDLHELTKIEEVDTRKLALIKLYLFAE